LSAKKPGGGSPDFTLYQRRKRGARRSHQFRKGRGGRRSAEELDRGEGSEERDGGGAHSDGHVAHCEVDLGFEAGDLGLNLGFEAGDLGLRLGFEAGDLGLNLGFEDA
jgi:hypothetical protein